MTDPAYTVATNSHSRSYPWRWSCHHTIPATAIRGDTSTRRCPGDGIAQTSDAAHAEARAHLAAAHDQVRAAAAVAEPTTDQDPGPQPLGLTMPTPDPRLVLDAEQIAALVASARQPADNATANPPTTGDSDGNPHTTGT
ncbi:hypothetical protein B4N89_02420 [Embleya scabrispora]|uniref:Uncharacterized protein n=1 Tax=Embleya scabrispora TaxID=159449 RepID=A0A1T3NTE2_9ACTN|nr:hypothetical protein [Embleya scabrispora]OPC79952.1 hypothetical protein B4N89_02420 [Embleya scabrispora]